MSILSKAKDTLRKATGRPGPRLLSVKRAWRLTPNMIRVTFAGPDLAGFPVGREGGNCLGTINKALDPEEIGPFVDALARRIAQFPAESINACKQMVYESIDKPINEALKAEAYWLYQATSKTPAIERFTIADEQGLEHDIEN